LVQFNETECDGTLFFIDIAPGVENVTPCIREISEARINDYLAIGLVVTRGFTICGNSQNPTPTVTPSVTPTRTPTPTPTVTPTRTPAVTPSMTPSGTPTASFDCYVYEYINNGSNVVQFNEFECDGTPYFIDIQPSAENVTPCLIEISESRIEDYLAIGLVVTRGFTICN